MSYSFYTARQTLRQATPSLLILYRTPASFSLARRWAQKNDSCNASQDVSVSVLLSMPSSHFFRKQLLLLLPHCKRAWMSYRPPFSRSTLPSLSPFQYRSGLSFLITSGILLVPDLLVSPFLRVMEGRVPAHESTHLSSAA